MDEVGLLFPVRVNPKRQMESLGEMQEACQSLFLLLREFYFLPADNPPPLGYGAAGASERE
jgi:hypothetical protein